MPDKYILNPDGSHRPACDLMEWARWFEETVSMVPNPRILASTVLPGDVRVSTVFLALNHNFADVGPPVLWETMIFGGEWDGSQWRYTSKLAALAHHEVIVARLRGGESLEGIGGDRAERVLPEEFEESLHPIIPVAIHFRKINLA